MYLYTLNGQFQNKLNLSNGVLLGFPLYSNCEFDGRSLNVTLMRDTTTFNGTRPCKGPGPKWSLTEMTSSWMHGTEWSVTKCTICMSIVDKSHGHEQTRCLYFRLPFSPVMRNTRYFWLDCRNDLPDMDIQINIKALALSSQKLTVNS